jgi:hypothetical protein
VITSIHFCRDRSGTDSITCAVYTRIAKQLGIGEGTVRRLKRQDLGSEIEFFFALP